MFEQDGRARTRVAAGVLAALLAVGCGGGGGRPRVDVEPLIQLPDSVPLGEPLDVGYQWVVSDGFTAPAEDYQVFVHFLDPQGEIAFQDDHYPPQPTSQWQEGVTPEYRRWVYLPEELEVEYLELVVGLFSADGRVDVRSGSEWTDSPSVHRLEIRADDMSGIPVYMDGWHASEQKPEGGPPWRWSEDVAHAIFTNPGRDAVLHLRAHAPYDEVGPQTITLRVGDTEVASFEVTTSDDFLQRIPIPAAALGTNDWAELTLVASPVYRPQEREPTSSDERVLGLQVFNMYLSSS
jgi:hypothetical protein